MSIGDVSLSSSARQNLLSLQSTSKLLGQTQARLASGKKVNSALDNASSYFASQGFLNSANDLSSLKDSMSTALQTIQAASDTIEALSTVVEQLQGIVNSALQTTDADTRSDLATQYNALIDQFDLLVADGTFNGTNLVNSINSSLKVSFSSTDANDNLTIQGTNLTSSGLGVGDALANFSSTTLVDTVTHTMNVSAVDQTLTSQVYSGTLSGLSVTGGASSGASSGVGATIASSSSTYGGATDGATVASIASGTVTNLVAKLGSIDNTSTTSIAGVTRSTTVGGATSNSVSLNITGQFTATGGAGSTYTSSTGVLTAGTANSITLGAGQSMSVIYDDGSTTVKTTVITNTTANDISFTLSDAADTVTAANTQANVTRTFKLTAGTVATTGLSIPTSASATLGGNAIVDSSDAAVGTDVTAIDSALSSYTSAGTRTTTGGTAYDVTGATITGVAVADVTATQVGTAAATYAAKDAHVTLTGASILSDDRTIVTADALTSAKNQLTDALKTLRSAASSLGNNNTIVSTRQDFTSNLITTLQTASDNLVLADTNEEGANLQSLQASSSLGIIALGISGQQAQAILRLF
ncbi:MAG: hypothetical protein PHW63_00240 [Alphaproteobacteria bacterium]|nr:hypothetical protein [Alphaproteobacteria bacterium]